MFGSNLRSLAGRDEVLSAVLDSLRRPGGHGAVIAAESGLGKTAVAAAAARELEADIPVYWIYCSPALTSVPYGALAALLPDIAPEETGSLLAVMGALMDKMEADAAQREPGDPGEDRAPLVIVDDAHDMDGPSLDLLAQMLDTGQIRLLVLTRTFSDVSGVLPHMWDGQLSRHSLPPLSEPEVRELCERTLSGQVGASTSIELARLSGGNPVYLLALIEESVASGFLLRRHGIWVVSDSGPPVGGRVADLVRARLRGLTAEDRSTLETICLAEPLPLTVAFRLGMHRSLDRLVKTLLVRVVREPGAGQTLRPLHPIYGQVIRNMVPAARSVRLLNQLKDHLPGPGQEGLLRWAAWSLTLGADVPRDVLLRAAEAANNRAEPRLALRAAAAADQGAFRVPARLQQARALLQLGDTAAAAAAVKGALEEAADLTTLKQAVTVRVQLALRTGGGNDWAASLAQAWTSAIDRFSGTEPPEDVEGARCSADMLLLLGQARDGQYTRTEMELGTVLARARAAGDEEAVLFAEALLAEVLVATGRAETALEHSRAAMALLRRDGSAPMTYCPFVLHRHLTVLAWLGEWEELRLCAGSAASPAQQTLLHSGGMADFALGLACLRSNATGDALRHFTAAAEAAALVKDPEGIRRLALGLGAFAAGSLGQRDLAARLHEEGEQSVARGPQQSRILADGTLAAGKFAQDADDASMRRLRDLADEAQERTFSAVEFTLRHLAMRLGDFSEAGRLLKLTEEFEGPQAPVLNQIARAVVDQDAAALASLASEPPPEMDLLLARQCLLEALRLARKGADRALLSRIQRLAGRQTGDLPTAVPALTRRENDVAELVAAGYRNAEIARRLHLSVRTVEGHIYRTYEKLGISRREELKARFPALQDPVPDWKRPSRAE